jgi:hypothetical protein
MTTTAMPLHGTVGVTREERKVMFASSLGTVFEWYDLGLAAALVELFGLLTVPETKDRDITYLD